MMDELITECPFIKSPFIADMINLFDSLRHKKKQFGVASCLLLTGESGSGKSELAKYYVKNNPVIEQDERTHVPVLHFELKSIATPKDLLRSLLIEIGDPQQGEGARNQDDLLGRLVTLINTVGIELLILDEIQVIIERRSQKVLTGIADLFKDLIKDTEIPIVFMGMPWSKYLVDSNQQLKRRIEYRHIIPSYRISQRNLRDDYRKLLRLLSDGYQLSTQFKCEGLPFTYRIFAATSGNLSNTAGLIRDAYIMSKMESKSVGVQLFSDVIRSYGVGDEDNPFLLELDQLDLKELIVHSDWRFGYRANKNAIIEGEYASYGISLKGKIYSRTGTA
ncbi:MAG: hypothetical protein ACJAVN_001812 [Roseivirga sp.]|jgi:hypothetical protein